MANFVSRTLLFLTAITSSYLASSQTSSCWTQLPNVTFPQSYAIIGDTSLLNQFRQILLVYNQNTQKLNIPKTLVNFTANFEFDSADVGSDANSECYSVRHQQGFPPLTTFTIKCRLNQTTVTWQEEGSHKVKGSIFVDPSGENVFWRSPKWPGEVHMTSMDRKESMMIFAVTKSWADSTTFLIDTQRRLIFWVNFGQSSISYSNLVAPSGPIETVPTNADATTFNSMALDFESGSIYWLVTSGQSDVIYRYNYTTEARTTELVASFGGFSEGQKSHLHFFNSSLSWLTKIGDDYQVEVFSLWENTTSSETALTCTARTSPKLIYNYNVFKTEGKREGLACKELNCSDICLDGPKPQCLCPHANTTLTGFDNNICEDIEIYVLQNVFEASKSPSPEQRIRGSSTRAMDERNGVAFWQDENAVKYHFLNDSSASVKTVFSTDGSVTIVLDEAHRTLILISTTGSATVLRYDDLEHFQTRNVHPNDNIKRSNFKYYCQRLYWIEQSPETGHDILNSFYFINGQIERVKLIPKGTKDFLIKVNSNGVDCGSIEIQPHVQQDTTTHKPAGELTTFMSAEQGAQTLSTAFPTESIQNGSSDPVLMHQLCQRYFETNGNGQQL